ncbi:unnamed protein product [Oikopleura dioica]|uniref:Uncharacterized protein n=2 Tax=Oikopleura dioica TaxID=34765 RepID=E4WSI5_OIKDI|nr:unnamed protein product [Oikopleura dioica]
MKIHTFLLPFSTLAYQIGAQFGSPYDGDIDLGRPPKCEEIKVPMCQGIGYNYTSMEISPFHLQTQMEVIAEAHQFYVLVQKGCSAELRPFLCGMYTPVCMPDYHKFLPPCRFLCERARAGCEPIMNEHGFEWPEKMNCELLPENQLCNDFGRKEIELSAQIPSTDSRSSSCRNCQCSRHLIDLSKSSQNFEADLRAWTTGGVSGCARTCQSPFLTQDERRFLDSWVLSGAVIVAIATVIVLGTFCLDPQRFSYPERPILYLSLCYLFIAAGYILRYSVGSDSISCDAAHPERLALPGRGTAYCNLVFVLTYYFGMASSIWWVMLTFAWFLAAGMKWSCEAISNYSSYMHAVAWTIPALQTILIMVTNQVDGDPFLGICSVGNNNIEQMHTFILAPLVVYLSAGGLFLIVGFFSLFRIRNTMKKQQDRETKKLEKLIIKIAIFSVLYMIPASIQVFCYFYESEFREAWEKELNCHNCGSRFDETSYLIIFLKPAMSFLVGIAAATWICCDKTLRTWKRMCCRQSPAALSTTTTSTLSNSTFSQPLNRHYEFEYTDYYAQATSARQPFLS